MSKRITQQGNSAIGFILFLAVIGYGIFVGIQYVPQYIESNTVRTILDNLQKKSKMAPLGTISAVESAIDNQLYINQMADMKDSFNVMQNRGDYVVTVKYERELNLLYGTKKMVYEKSVTLK
ncbi:MAG: DUF4845 domain-containing protein [Xanthomonadales bacterium]|jgi:hypothetical protein|nr:DUF4845 domain-containing protein [Xanthomonadales bacterium]MDH3926147.1 DUF4845 domain-containing protein [Xanthomonadales bacterium]MDH3939913.1 DUF4845 domain-containing protein [Xanthomonadales bacterium]MDH4001629.1 DUF4845 domain-containing protein [Xanthomonadales bacterium]